MERKCGQLVELKWIYYLEDFFFGEQNGNFISDGSWILDGSGGS